jgi:hypothetical protein
MNTPLGIHLIKNLMGALTKLAAKQSRRTAKGSGLANQDRPRANTYFRSGWTANQADADKPIK